ncbi:cytochrome c3 family protein, partial [bacterium]|nr:cytochrome c3 family protein [bacterium]
MPACAETDSSNDCLDCHEATKGEQYSSYLDAVYNSSHEGLECADCHEAIDELPHDENLAEVSCGVCHDEEAAVYKWHGRLEYPDGDDIPSCADCHGKHSIYPSTEKKSMVHPTNLPETCAYCHEDLDLTRKHEIYVQKPIKIYES